MAHGMNKVVWEGYWGHRGKVWAAIPVYYPHAPYTAQGFDSEFLVGRNSARLPLVKFLNNIFPLERS